MCRLYYDGIKMKLNICCNLGSRRPSLTSIHSGSSIRSYSARRYERERQQKEEREMQKRLSKMTSTSNSSCRVPPTPSPHSIDEQFPTIEEIKRVIIPR